MKRTSPITRQTVKAQEAEIVNQRRLVATLREVHSQDSGLLVDMHRKLSQMRYEMDRAKRIAGQMSVLFPAQRKDVETARLDRLQYRVLPPIMWQPGNQLDVMREQVRDIPLHVMLEKVSRHDLEQMVHLKIAFADKQVGYAISDSALGAVPIGDMVQDIAMQMAEQLVSAIKGNRIDSY